jgi:hypothetical protein
VATRFVAVRIRHLPFNRMCEIGEVVTQNLLNLSFDSPPQWRQESGRHPPGSSSNSMLTFQIDKSPSA